MRHQTDEKLIQLYLAGGEEALVFLIERHLKGVYNFVVRFIGGDRKEAEDLTQEIFLKVWKNLKKFDRTKNFRVWLFRIARNTGIDYLRKKKMLVFSALENEEDDRQFADKIADTSESVIDKINKTEAAQELQKYLAGLAEASRTVLLLYYGEHLTFQEIADLLGEPLDTVKSRQRRALIRLKNLIGSTRI